MSSVRIAAECDLNISHAHWVDSDVGMYIVAAIRQLVFTSESVRVGTR